MAINKITPRVLDKATDYKLVPSTSFIDAVNVSLTEDESNEGDDGGDRGVIKNVKGNSAIRFYRQDDVIADGDYKVIGTTVDRKLKLVYIYLYHENLAEQGVWVYDKNGVLSLPQKYRDYDNPSGVDNDGSLDPNLPDTIKCIAKGPFFNFKQHSVVQGNVVYANSLNFPIPVEKALKGESSFISVTTAEKNVFEKSIHLYFTDNKNEPKKIDVTASLFARGSANEGFESAEGGFYKLPEPGNVVEEILYCYACKPTPASRPQFDWVRDPSSNVSNFEKSEGFKFAYQIVFNDGSVSAISPKSELAVAPSLILQGKDLNPDHKQYNQILVIISNEFLTRNTSGTPLSYVKRINVLAQEGAGPYKLIKEVDSSEFTGTGLDTSVSVPFKNDVIGIAIADSEKNKYFDSVPQKAEAQAVVDNRLMYGNYVEGYPVPELSAQFIVTSEDSEDFIPGELGEVVIQPSISREIENHSNDGGVVIQHMAGFRISIADGAFLQCKLVTRQLLRLKMTPQRNFHLYNASGSYHQSRRIGTPVPSGSTESELKALMANTKYIVEHEEAGSGNLMPGANTTTKTNITANNTTVYDNSFHAFKDNGGVASYLEDG